MSIWLHLLSLWCATLHNGLHFEGRKLFLNNSPLRTLEFQGASNKYAELRKGQVKYPGDRHLAQYDITHYDIIDNVTFQAIDEETTAVQVRIWLSRLIMTHAITKFLPSFIICIACYLTNLFVVRCFWVMLVIYITSFWIICSLPTLKEPLA